MPKIVTFTLSKGTEKKDVKYNLPVNWDSLSETQRTDILNKKRDQLTKQDASKTYTISSPVIGTSSTKLKEDVTTVYLGEKPPTVQQNKKIDKDAQKAYIAVLKGVNQAPEFETIPSYYDTAEDQMTINNVRYPNTDPNVEQPDKNEFAVKKNQKAFIEPPKETSEKPDAEDFGYDNSFMRKKYTDKARKAYFDIVNKRIDKEVEKPTKVEKKEKEFDKILKKYKKVVKEDSNIEKVYEDENYLIVSPTALKAIPGFIKDYGKGTTWITENTKRNPLKKMYIAIEKTKDLLSDSTSKLLITTESDDVLKTIDSQGNDVEMIDVGLDPVMFDKGTKSDVDVDDSSSEEMTLYSKDNLEVKVPLTLNAMVSRARGLKELFGTEPWKLVIRDTVVKDLKPYIIIDDDAGEEDPFSQVFVSVAKDGKIDAYDAKNNKIEEIDKFLSDKGISRSYFKGTDIKESIESHLSGVDVSKKLKELDYEPTGFKMVTKVKLLPREDRDDIQIITFAGDKEETYLRDLLSQVGYVNADTAKMTYIDALDETDYCVYEFLGLQRS